MINYPAFEDIKQFYDWGCYTNEQISEYVDLEILTKDQYTEITKEAYSK